MQFVNKKCKNMNELILFILVVAILIGSQFLVARIRKPLANYIGISAAIFLLLLVWLFSGHNNNGPRIVLSILAISTIVKEYLSIRKLRPNS